MFIPDPDLDFLPIPDPGVTAKAPDLGYGSATKIVSIGSPKKLFLSSRKTDPDAHPGSGS